LRNRARLHGEADSCTGDNSLQAPMFPPLAGCSACANPSSANRRSGRLDFSAWCAGMAVMPFVIVAALAVFGFRVSLGGRKLLKQEL